MVRVVTITGESGSGRRDIGRRLAERLGWRLVDNALIEQIARTAHVDPSVAQRYDECLDPWFHSFQKALWRGGYEGSVAATDSDVLDADTVAGLARCVIEAEAQLGECIIIGRGSACILQDDPSAFHVFIYAPRSERIERARHEHPAEDPDEWIDDIDRRRTLYIRRHFDQEWTNRHLYNMMICSSAGIEAVTDAIAAAIVERQNA